MRKRERAVNIVLTVWVTMATGERGVNYNTNSLGDHGNMGESSEL